METTQNRYQKLKRRCRHRICRHRRGAGGACHQLRTRESPLASSTENFYLKTLFLQNIFQKIEGKVFTAFPEANITPTLNPTKPKKTRGRSLGNQLQTPRPLRQSARVRPGQGGRERAGGCAPVLLFAGYGTTCSGCDRKLLCPRCAEHRILPWPQEPLPAPGKHCARSCGRAVTGTRRKRTKTVPCHRWHHGLHVTLQEIHKNLEPICEFSKFTRHSV